MKKVLIIVPCYNEQNSIEKLVDKVKKIDVRDNIYLDLQYSQASGHNLIDKIPGRQTNAA